MTPDPKDLLRDWDELLAAYRRPCSDDLIAAGAHLAEALRLRLAEATTDADEAEAFVRDSVYRRACGKP